VHVPVPEQAPDQPANLERVEAAAVSVTRVPYVKVWAQAEPQLIPAELEVTVPVPRPAFVSVSVLSVSNLAVAPRSALIVTVQGPVPEQAPDQPANDDPAEAVAVSVTGTAPKGTEQLEPQSIPFGVDATEPEPLPALATVRVLPR
jgi:hypothetical protein